MVTLQLKRVQKFYRINQYLLFALALMPVVLLVLYIVGAPKPVLGVFSLASLIFTVLVVIRQITRFGQWGFNTITGRNYR
jgi:flagellar biosynthesis component FlhA